MSLRLHHRADQHQHHIAPVQVELCPSSQKLLQVAGVGKCLEFLVRRGGAGRAGHLSSVSRTFRMYLELGQPSVTEPKRIDRKIIATFGCLF